MGLFSRSDLDKILKYLNKKDISVKNENGKYWFEIVMRHEGYTIYPYFTVENDLFSVVINLRKLEKINDEVFRRLNDFNLKARFFKALLKKDIVYLEADMPIDDNITNVFELLVNEIASLETDINSL